MKNIDWLVKNIENPNIAEELDKDTLGEIGSKVVSGYQADESSREEWKSKAEFGLEIAKQITKAKTHPWSGAANIKFPMIATAAIQFAARSYPSILTDNKPVKGNVIGSDPDGKKAARAKRIGAHMSYQLMEEMTEWESDTDQLLHGLPVFGTYFRKTYFDPLQDRNVSISINPLKLVINQAVKDVKTARRITHEIDLYRNDVIERERSEQFLKLDAEYMTLKDEIDEPEMFLEQHRWLDLDDDGYEEPYIVTVHEPSSTVVRVVADYDQNTLHLTEDSKVRRIERVEYFTKFDFIPDPEGKFYSLGFAHLLGPINESINTLINQLLDAGSLSNLQCGFFAKGIRVRGGMMNFQPGEWKPVETTGGMLKDNIFPLPVRDPSNVLFQLLGLLNDTGMKLASVSEAMTGETPSQNTPATTTLATIEQGLKVFTAIYKRVFRSLRSEYKKLFRLNRLYLTDQVYFTMLDEQGAVAKADYETDSIDVVPVADPSLASEAQELARVQALMQTFQMNPSPQGKMEILKQYYEGIKAKNIDKLLSIDPKTGEITLPEPPPDPDLIEMQLKATKQSHDYEFDKSQNETLIIKMQAEIEEIKARTIKLLAEAEAVEPGQQLENYMAQAKVLGDKLKLEIEALKAKGMIDAKREQNAQSGSKQGGAGGLAPKPNNQESAPVLPPHPQQSDPGLGVGSGNGPQISGGDVAADISPVGEDMGGGPNP